MLKDVCTINMGQSPASDSYNDEGEGVPFFQGNADFGDRYPITRKWCSAPTKMAMADDILISVRAPIGAMNYAKEACCIGRGLAALTPNKTKVSPEFIFWCLKGKNHELNSKGTGSTFKAIGRKVLEETLIPNVPLEKQKKYSDILKKVYAIIQMHQHQLQQLDFLVQSRFIELFGDMYLNSKGWPEAKLESMADIVSGITKGRKTRNEDLIEVPYMAVSNVKDGYIDWTTVKKIEATQQEIEQYRLLPDDVLMTEGGDPDKVGRGAIIKEPLENCIHQNHIFRVRLDESVMFPEFFEEYLQHQRSKCYFLRCAKQTTGIASINMTQLRALPVLIPPLAEQAEFVSFKTETDKSKLILCLP
ncbi:MAG TPA: hypothetical protein DD632_02745 [Oribacterium sp.]|nr:hypothetical protein [Oribacterium sp.]